MGLNVLGWNHSRKDPPDREPQSFRPHIAVDTSKAVNPGTTGMGSANIKYEESKKPYNIRRGAETFFTRGRVFAMLWHESAGVASRAGSLVVAASSAAVMTRFAERGYSQIRRMIVVREMHGYCRCLPINTYTNTYKIGSNAYAHGTVGVAENASVFQAPQASDSILDRLVSLRQADGPLYDHD
jgi:hypothetical protein